MFWQGGCKKVGFTPADRELGYVLFFDIISNGAVHTLIMMFVYLGELLQAGDQYVEGICIYHLLAANCLSQGFANLQVKTQWWEYLFVYTIVRCGNQYF